MGFDSPQEGASALLHSFFHSHMDELFRPGSSSISKWPEPSATVSSQNYVKDQSALITPPPELRLREAIPEPQNGADCQQASQSASQAIQQANQLASDSIRQASQQASQSADAASRSATDAIRQAQQSASQSISAASRSAASALSSASSVVSSVQASAADAISKANAGQSSAQASASNAQVEASKAVLQAGAAVAAATGKAAAAGSSFLAAAAAATESAQASVLAFGSAAASQIAQASQVATQSQTTAITATQIAVAIVGSIIASTLITILVFFLVARHKKKKKEEKRRSRDHDSGAYPTDPKFPVSDQVATTIADSQGAYTASRLDPGRGTSSQASFSLFPKISSGDNQPAKQSAPIKTTSVPWNPANPPKPPSLGSWLKAQDGISPFGPIKLPTDENSKAPLGGQLKSPLRSISNKPQSPVAPRFVSSIPVRSPKIPNLSYRQPLVVATDKSPPIRQDSVKRKPVSPEKQEPIPDDKNIGYRESKASVWTDDMPESGPLSPYLPSPPAGQGATTATKAYSMQIPSPKKPIRSTAEWLLEQQRMQDSPRNSTESRSQIPVQKNSRPSFAMGLPRNPRLGLPTRPGPERQIKSMQGEVGYVQGLSRFLEPGNRDSNLSRYPSDRSQLSVGKAL